MFKPPLQLFITDHSKAVVLLWFSVAYVWCQGFGFTLCVLILLAHLSRRLIGELIVYPWSGVRRRPSVVRRTSSVVRRPQCSNIFFSETAWPIKAKFYVEPPWVGGTKLCSRHLGLQNRRADFHETWYVASRTPAHHKLFK